MTELSSQKPLLAYLGPEGTYTHQAANDYFGERVSYLSCQTISAAFHALEASADIALLPSENSTHGAVIETLDLLRIADPKTHFIRGEVFASINHCLLARKGTKWEDIRTVLSHEQALGQCSAFLRDRLPSARLVKTVSTAAAAEQVLRDSTSTTAAVCSGLCAKIHPELEILAERIQDSAANVTKFIVLSSPETTIPSATSSAASLPSQEAPQSYGILRILLPTTGGDVGLSEVFAAIHPLGIARVDRRPSLSSTLFHDAHFVTVQSKASATDAEWGQVLDDAVKRLPDGVECTILGIWRSDAHRDR